MKPRTQVLDPFKLARVCWPHVSFYAKQREIIRSVEENDETFVSAGNGVRYANLK